MNNSPTQKVGRIAFRQEGDWWNAYYAMPDTMKDALLLGSIRVSAVQDANAKQHFMEAMRAGVSAIFRAEGANPEWRDPTIAPEHERSGRA